MTGAAWGCKLFLGVHFSRRIQGLARAAEGVRDGVGLPGEGTGVFGLAWLGAVFFSLARLLA